MANNKEINNGFTLNRNTFYRTPLSAPTCVEKTDSEYRIILDIAGLDPKSALVDIQDGTLCIRGEKQSPSTINGNRSYYRNEILSGYFSRTFSLPNDADKDNISASYKHGYLTVVIKILPEKLPKNIDIHVED